MVRSSATLPLPRAHLDGGHTAPNRGLAQCPAPAPVRWGFAGLRDRAGWVHRRECDLQPKRVLPHNALGPRSCWNRSEGAVPVLVSPFQHYPPRAASAIGLSSTKWLERAALVSELPGRGRDGRPTRRAVPAQARQGRQACGVQGVHCREHESGTCENSRAAPASRRRESKRRAHSVALNVFWQRGCWPPTSATTRHSWSQRSRRRDGTLPDNYIVLIRRGADQEHHG